MREKIGIEELLKTTNYKKIKEYMRTDKPSRRKLYIEIYEFKDKEMMKKLPCKRDMKTDEAKTGIVEYDATNKEIIQMKLSPLNRTLTSLIRLKQYAIDFNVDTKGIQRTLTNGTYAVYGRPVSEDVTKDFERWYLITERDGTIIGYFSVAWSSQLDGQNHVLKWGGDIATVGISTKGKLEEEVDKVMNDLFDREEFKKLPMMCIGRDYGSAGRLDRFKWANINTCRSCIGGYVPRKMWDTLAVRDAIYLYYKLPPINELGNAEMERTWIDAFKVNYVLRWERSHPVDYPGITSEEITKKQTEQKAQMEIDMNTALAVELRQKKEIYEGALSRWKRDQEVTISSYGQDFLEESVYGAINRLSEHRRDQHGHEYDGNEDDDCDDSDVDHCQDCGRYATEYCREECEHSPCHDCENDCDYCDVAGNG